MTKVYLGDGVYVDVENDMIKLTTEDGIRVTNTILLDDTVVEALLAFLKRVYGAALIDGRIH